MMKSRKKLIYIFIQIEINRNRNKLNQRMHIQNQPSQNIYYYPPYQGSSLGSGHAGQQNSNSYSYSRETGSGGKNINSESEMSRHKIPPTYQSQNQYFSFRKDMTKLGNYPTQKQSNFGSVNYTNPESRQLQASKLYHTMDLQSPDKGKYIVQAKRKQTNYNAKEIREQYYKNQQIQPEIIKSHQIESQPILKNNNFKMINIYTSPESKSKQVRGQSKRNIYPPQINTRSISFKQANNQSSLMKRMDTSENQQIKRIKQGLKFNSPIKNNSQVSKNLKDLDIKMKTTSNNEKTQESLNLSYKKQKTPQTSNSSSFMYQNPLIKPTIIPYKSNYPSFLNSAKQSKIDVSIQTNYYEQPNRKQISKYTQTIKKLEDELQREKTLSAQRELKFKIMQQQINAQKINFDKKLFIAEKQLAIKIQNITLQLKQQHQNKIIKLSTQMKEKSLKQLKEVSLKYQNIIENTKKQNEKQHQQLMLKLQQKQRKIIDFTIKNIQFEKFKVFFQQKMSTIQNELHRKNLMISNLQTKQQQMNCYKKQLTKLKAQKSTNTQKQINVVSQNGIIEQKDLIEKNRILEQSRTNYLNNIDKYTQKYKQSKAELDKSQRKIQQFSSLLFQKDSIIRNMGKDLKNREKCISELRKVNQTLQNLNKVNSDNLVKQKLKMLNQKYNYIK